MARSTRALDVALAGGIGTACGLAYLQFCRDLAHWSAFEILAFFAGTAIVAWLAWRFVEPFFGALFLTGHLVAGPRHPPRTLNLRRYARVFVVVLTTAVFAEALLHALTHRPIRVVEWITAVLAYGAVTYGWTVGAARRPPRAGRWGALAGALIGLTVSGVVGVLAYRLALPGFFPPDRPPGVASVAGYAAGGAFSMAARGFLGGKAIDLGGRLPTGVRVVLAVGVVALLQGIAAAAMGSPDWWSRVAEPIGWGAGLLFYPRAGVALGPHDERAADSSRDASSLTPLPPRPSAPARERTVTPGRAEAAGQVAGWRGRVSVALAGGIGAASGIAYWNFVEHVRHWTSVQIGAFFGVTVIVTWLAWRYFQPFFAAVLLSRRLPGTPDPEPRARRRFTRTFLAVLTSAVTLEVLFHSLMIRRGQGLVLWLGTVVMFGVITYAWASAAKRRPTRAGRVGALSGGLVGAATLGSLGVFMGGGAVFPETQVLGASAEPSFEDAIGLAVTGFITMAARGYGGGKAIDVGGRVPVGFRVMLGVGVVVAAQIALEYVTIVAFGVPIHSQWQVWVLEAVGWGAGVLLCPYSEPVLAGSIAEPARRLG